jgi:hypothetical protein
MVCGAAITCPLVLGHIRGDVPDSIYGGLSGFLMALSDHRATVRHRLLIATIAFMAGWLGFASGICLQHHFMGFIGVSLFATYGLGLLGGRGGEFERLILFAILELVLSRYALVLSFARTGVLTLYIFVAYVTVVACILISRLTMQNTVGYFIHPREAVRLALTRDPSRHRYAVEYCSAVLLAILCDACGQLARGYWAIITRTLGDAPGPQGGYVSHRTAHVRNYPRRARR